MATTTYRSPNGQTFELHPDAVGVVEPFFNRLNQVYPGYQSAGGYAHRPMRTLDGRNLGGLSSHATGYTLDVKAPDHVLRQMHQEFPHLKWGGKFSHYDPVHFEFGPTAMKHGELPPLNPASLLDPKAAAPVAGPGPQPIAGGAAPMTPTSPVTPFDGMMPADVQKHRKLAQLLAGQATDASPVGHWTQALARVIQGGVGRMHDNAASEGERQGQASIVQMMNGNPSAAAMMANPYTREMGEKLWLTQRQMDMESNSPMARARLAATEGSERRAAELHPGQLAAQKAAAEAARIGQIDPSKPTYRMSKDGSIEWITPPEGVGGPSPDTIKSEAELRKEYTGQQQVKQYQTVRNAYQNVQNAAKDPSAAGDLSMIFAYMKILDPDSVVREQEFANAQNAAGVPDRVRNVYNKILTGQRLNPAQRADFLAQAEKLHDTSRRQYEAVRTQFGDIAKGAKARPEQVMIDFGAVPVKVKTPEDARKLPSGTPIMLPDGTIGKVP